MYDLFKRQNYPSIILRFIKSCQEEHRTFGTSALNPGAGFLRIFTVAFDGPWALDPNIQYQD